MVLPGLELGWLQERLQELILSLPILAKGGKGGGGKKGGAPPKPPELPPLPPLPPPPPSISPEDPAAVQARKDAEDAARKAQGRRSLITNIGGAAGDLSEAPTGKGTLISLKTKTGA